MEQKNQKTDLVLKIFPFESGAINSHSPEQDTCHWQSMCSEATPGVNISLKEIFSQSGSLGMTKKYDESVLMPILQVFGTLFNMFTFKGFSETVLFREWSNHSLWQSLISEIK